MTVQHSTFVLERTYDAAPARVYAAWAEPEAKAHWFGANGDEFALDFRVGGRETNGGGAPGGPHYTYEATYRDIVPEQRIVYTYVMHVDGALMSVSVATVQFEAAGEGTRLTLTEHGAYLDGHDTPEQREHGTGELLDKLGSTLAGAPAGA
jgi:uncharacterized protein YndB with AHSA1/START domain